MTKIKKTAIKVLSVVLSASLLSSFLISNLGKSNGGAALAESYVSKFDKSVNNNVEDYFDSNVVYQLPETVSSNDEISVIVSLDTDSLMDAYSNTKTSKELTDYLLTDAASAVAKTVAAKRDSLINKLVKSGINFEVGEEYDTVLSGFEVTIKAKDFDRLTNVVGERATLIVGETYEPAVTEIVTNEVDVYETGIFDSSSSTYQGDGVVVAVLDSGLDYTHSAFEADNFYSVNEAFNLNEGSDFGDKVANTVAADFTLGLSVEDVYVSRKIPYAYDYADKDTDVLPTNSDHGTHVSGIIAGNDDTITGVAPNAQIAFMKVFSDFADGAKTSWLLAALEDCVHLGVDVINMSLGSSCGFAREVDDENVNTVYDSIRDAGISLVVSAGNSYNSTMGSEKNGNLGLTSNPDSGTVGSPSTYAASLSVASVDGVKTPYILYNDDIIYFNEATNSAAKTKNFVNEVLATLGSDVTSHTFEYVTIPGIGRSTDYPKDASYYAGKIVLVKRGTTTFEEKIRVALKEKGAAGIIIYNNVSGTISMSAGDDYGAACSISQADGELLAANEIGYITISKSQIAGPFMSDFSSWGPTSDLQIKPEITAHGGEILSAICGGGYDRMSGTSMAAPNQTGATALIRQYVKDNSELFGSNLTTNDVTAIVNRLMMSTADIIYNKNGLPYAVRKQGSGLVNITKAYTSASYITTFDKYGNEMDKTKIELGDDKNKTGEYEMTFSINNVSNSSVSYNIDSVIMTEGVSDVYTSHGETTVTQDGYLLEGTKTTVTSVSGGTNANNVITVGAKSTATVTVTIKLSSEDKKYLDDSFENGMYVEGFITLKATSGTNVDMNVPVLAFYGDWNEAPILDEEYYDTNADELNMGIDQQDKLMPDAYATKVVGGFYSDYIAVLGSYYFQQDPSATPIAANKDYIAISNFQDDTNSAINSLEYIWAGLLRNAKQVEISIVEDSTGKEIFNRVNYDQRKSYSSGSTIYYSSTEVDFSSLEYNLKNNTKYTVTYTTYIDYGTHKEQDEVNKRNTFTFPLYIDFEAPVVTDVVYRTEYDKTTKKTSLFADLSVYDNHYAMGLQLGQIVPEDDPNSNYTFKMKGFGKYVTPVYSSFNSTSVVTVELTDYVAQLKNSAGFNYEEDGTEIVYNNNSFIVSCYDYAFNSATYEIRLPDEILSMYFNEETITLNPYDTQLVSEVLNIFPAESWLQVLDFESSDSETVDIVNQTIIAKKSGSAIITAIGYDENGNQVTASVNVHVRAPGETGYYGNNTIPEVNKFTVTGYYVNKAYYSISTEEREIGLTGQNYEFDGNYSLSMFPSESVTLKYQLDSYFPNNTSVVFKSANSNIATVSEDGTIVALKEGVAVINLNVYFQADENSEPKSTLYSGRVIVTVKDPFTTNSIYLMSYKGLGGTVEIPSDRGITTIYSYAFSGYEYVEKDLEAGDVIDEEDPYYIKQMYLGDDTITKVIIPEGVTTIEAYAFANLTALEEVVLPTTLTRIGRGAFYNCTNLKKINLQNVKFINEKAFYNCAIEDMEDVVSMDSMVAISNYAFQNCKFNYIILPESTQSIGEGAFFNNVYLTSVQLKASKVKIGDNAFAGCEKLSDISINAAVISAYAFYGCTNLTNVKLGKDVSIIGEFAFAETNVSVFTVDARNTTITAKEGGAMLYKGDELILVAPKYSGKANTVTTDALYIATGAFANNTKVFHVIANSAIYVGPYAFAECTNLQDVQMESVTEICEYAFTDTALNQTPNLQNVTFIGDGAFANTNITKVNVADATEVGAYAFAYCTKLTEAVIGNNVSLGEGAFYCPAVLFTYDNVGSFTYYNVYDYEVKDQDGNVVETYSYYRYDYTAGAYSSLTSLTIGNDVYIGDYAFSNAASLQTVTLGDNAVISMGAFYNAANLKNIDLSKAVFIGDYAFSGSYSLDYWLNEGKWSYAYKLMSIDGNLYSLDYAYSGYSPLIETADLSNVAYVGKSAFAYNRDLNSVIFSDEESLTHISDGMFIECSSLESVQLPSYISSIGNYAFYGSPIAEIDLSNVSSVGDYAFASSSLNKVTFNTEVLIGDSAFAYDYNLTEVENINKATSIGAYAFVYTSLTEVDLQSATYIGDYAFSGSLVKKVNLGDNLTLLGENPFFACNIATFGREKEITYGSVTVTETTETYDLNGGLVKIINGVLYQTVPNGGLELVSYPIAKTDVSYVVEEGTVRISANAFAYSALQNVTLASTLKAIGDKAFYGCNNLSVVIFKSYTAPILEEEYNESYFNENNLPYSGTYYGYEGLGISKFYMWNTMFYYNNIYYGANFVDYIGHIANKLVMVKPANGKNYDTFIFSQYFYATVEGNNAATENTLNVMAMIAALPNYVDLTNKQAVAAAREAYDALPSVEQQALVSNYSKLVTAEQTIEYLEINTQPEPVEPEPNTGCKSSFAGYLGAVVALIMCYGVTFIIRRKNNNKN